MTEPTENEGINEELPTEELKSVSGGISDEPAFQKLSKVDSKSAISDEPAFFPKPEGSGSGMTKDDYRTFIIVRNRQKGQPNGDFISL
ncbi:hypothetical protein PMIT1313_00398 [Prochlorococcus marinus str. MIT 1313]|uniref:hypothetical protein n=1 Tax=Prochlorococcus TaxID=1218 RepID=UPI0007B35E5A|nr:hypothetical protein [Prochlorococcus marinus]KZR70578.1 hypothetical protein PMIT1313_00398 [Prochlorococcus marinus str. MIT 1313]